MPGVHFKSGLSKPVGRSQGHASGASAKPKSLKKAIMIYTHLLKRDWGGVILQLCGPRVL
jgi:hypothetical protein